MTMNPKCQRTRLAAKSRRRNRRRGAALVEAAVVIPVMLVFLGLTMWVHNSYDEKLASQTSTRAQVLFYGSHNCEEEVPEEMSVQLGTKTSGSASSSTSDSADPAPGEGAGVSKTPPTAEEGLKRSWNLVRTHRDTTVGGTAVQDREKVAFSVPITSNSEVACNEKRFDNDWTAVFGFIKGFLKSGGGIIN
jgi:hypothetical protein